MKGGAGQGAASWGYSEAVMAFPALIDSLDMRSRPARQMRAEAMAARSTTAT